MKKYSLTDKWENDKPVNTFDFDTLEELQQIPSVKKALQNANFFRLSILVSSVLSYYPPNYSTFALLAELHDGYIYEELGFLTKNPYDKFNYGFPSGAKTPPVVCLDFDPIKELGIPHFNYYDWIVYKLIGGSGANTVMKLTTDGADIEMIKKFIEFEIQYQLEHPEYNKSLINTDKILNKHNKE